MKSLRFTVWVPCHIQYLCYIDNLMNNSFFDLFNEISPIHSFWVPCHVQLIVFSGFSTLLKDPSANSDTAQVATFKPCHAY